MKVDIQDSRSGIGIYKVLRPLTLKVLSMFRGTNWEGSGEGCESKKQHQHPRVETANNPCAFLLFSHNTPDTKCQQPILQLSRCQ
jgi:hypothetical protein